MSKKENDINLEDYETWNYNWHNFYFGVGLGFWIEDYSKNKNEAYIGKVNVIILPFVMIKFGWLGVKNNIQ